MKRRFVLSAVLCLVAALCLSLLLAVPPAAAAEKGQGKEAEAEEEQDVLSAPTFAGLALRGIGPGLASGRITEIVVDPTDRSTWYVAVASGNLWKTTNAGTTWTPIFDDQGSYSIGTVALDPNDPLTVWVGTGENNSQRSVAYGDGVYRSRDGGATWEHMGLEESEHVARIWIDPRDSNTVFVAAQGPLWSEGGHRGLYKTTDGGAEWKRVLHVDEHTGVTDLVVDPRDPDVMVAATYQRRRHVWVLIDGGPGSGVHKSTDGGETWREIETGLPKVQLGRIGLAIAPTDPDVLYAIVEAAQGEGGFFRSTDRGESWTKRSDYVASSPQYYQELVVDPHDASRVYSLDTFTQVSEDGGATWSKVGTNSRHVDDHALWIDPEDTRHLIIGGDGGVYESFDRGASWQFFQNLPITQFYKVAVDDDTPFYHVYGGTQDNNTLGGPARTNSGHGILNRHWFVTVSGDGFKTQVDPTNPDIVYSQWQYGGLVRFDRKSGEIVDIQPQPEPGEPPMRWNWSSALLISPHSPTRLYYAAQRIFRSDDRGDSWRPVSPDLTRDLDRNQLEVMGRVWSVDAVAKNASTSFYGNIVSLAESPLVEGLLYAGTDDGLVQVSEDGGESWRQVESFPGVPDMSYVSDLEASLHDADTVFATFDNHKRGDFTPYVLRSSDRGRTWSSIAGDLPERGHAHAVAEDHVNPELLFVGTEFGVFFTGDGGGRWIQLTGGVPTIAIRDVEIQRRENDLVLASFGRGFYVLDDYAPLRTASREVLESEAALFPVRPAKMYVEKHEFGFPGKGFQGDDLYAAPNPPFGAVFTYHLTDALQSLEEARREEETELREAWADAAYPSWEELRAEDREDDPVVLLTVRDEEGNVVRRITGPVEAGFHRVAWDLRYPAPDPVNLNPPEERAPWESEPLGPLAAPGRYTVELAKRVRGETTPLAGPEPFGVVPLNLATLGADDREALLAFQQKTARLQRAVQGAVRAVGEAETRLAHLEAAWRATPDAAPEIADRVDALQNRLADLGITLRGDETVASRNEPTSPAIVDRVQRVVYGHWTTTAAPTETQRRAYAIAAEAFAEWLPELRQLVEDDLPALEAELEEAGAPWTPGRVPQWQAE